MAIEETWNRIETTLRNAAPRFSLPAGAREATILACEQRLGLQLPPDYRASVALHDGTADYFLFNSELAPIGTVVAVREDLLRMVRELGPQISPPRVAGPIRNDQRWNPEWIPIARTTSADDIFLDLDPDVGGSVGQVVHITREMGELELLAPSFESWLTEFANDLVGGRYEIHVLDTGVSELVQLERRK